MTAQITNTADHIKTDLTTVEVGLGDKAYKIHIGSNILTRVPTLCADHFHRRKTMIVTDANVAHFHLEALNQVFAEAQYEVETVILEPGEATKSMDALKHLCDRLLEGGMERDDVLIAFGGGVVGDLAGFAAAVLRRGINFIQIPTTLLAQVDSSVGGKTGINSKYGKNLIGAFHQPVAVIADIDLLNTLPKRQFRSGYAEVAKYGLLGDTDFFTWLEQSWAKVFKGDKGAIIKTIETCCRAKADLVVADEREAGARALLNLGHTFAHALEAATGYSDRLLHGEAVAIGMSAAFHLSEQLAFCPSGTAKRVDQHLTAVGLATSYTSVQGGLPNAEKLLEIMRQDKKSRAGAMTLILAHDIGNAFITRDVDQARIKTFLADLLGEK